MFNKIYIFFIALQSYIYYYYNLYINYRYPYKKIIIDDRLDDIINKNDTNIMNNIHNGYNSYNKEFNRQKKILLYYHGERIFNTVLHVNSYKEINIIVKKIQDNSKDYKKKINIKMPNIIEHVYFVKHNSHEFDVLKIMFNCIEFDGQITFSDISYLCHEIPQDIKYMKVIYFKNFKKHTREICFEEYKNKCINHINDVFI